MYKNINIPENTSLFIVGDIHEHFIQFNKMLDIISPSNERWVCFVGDVYDKGYGEQYAELITERIIDLKEQGFAYTVKGNHELKIIRKYKKQNNLTKYLKWWDEQPTIINFKFLNRNKITILHAGVTLNHNINNIYNDLEVCYVRDIDVTTGKMIPLEWKIVDGKKELHKKNNNGVLWHKLYDGRFGYIVSGHIAQPDGKIRFYRNSCNIDSCVYDTGLLSALEIDNWGHLKTIQQVSGPAFKPQLSIKY